MGYYFKQMHIGHFFELLIYYTKVKTNMLCLREKNPLRYLLGLKKPIFEEKSWFCRNIIEDRYNLFFECPWSKREGGKLLQVGASIRNPKFHCQDIMLWGVKISLKGTSLRFIIYKTALWFASYHLWRLRIGVLHRGRINSDDIIIKTVKWEVKVRVAIESSLAQLLDTLFGCLDFPILA